MSGKKYPGNAYGARVPKWTNHKDNMRQSDTGSYRSKHLFILDDVDRNPAAAAGGSPDDVQHAYCCNLVAGAFGRNIKDCIIHSVRWQPGQSARDFKAYFTQEFAKYGPEDYLMFYFHGRAGGEMANYTWTFRGPGPTRINANDFVLQANASTADLHFILDCRVPTVFPDSWMRKAHMTEFSISGGQMTNINGQTINGPGNYTESLCRSMRRVLHQPTRHKRPSLHEIISSGGGIAFRPIRIWTARPVRPSGNKVWRTYFRTTTSKRTKTKQLDIRKCLVTGPRPGDGEFRKRTSNKNAGQAGGGDEDGGDDGDGGGSGNNHDDEDDDDHSDDDHSDDDHSDDDHSDGDDDDDDDDSDDTAGPRRSNDTPSQSPDSSTGSSSPGSGLGKRKRAHDQEASVQTPRLSNDTSPSNAGRDVSASGSGESSSSDEDDDEDDGGESLFVRQSEDGNSARGSAERATGEESALPSEENIDPIEENYNVNNVNVNIHGDSVEPAIRKDKQADIPRLGGLLNLRLHLRATSPSPPAESPSISDRAEQLPTPAHDTPSQGEDNQETKSIKKSESPDPDFGGQSRTGGVDSVKPELASPIGTKEESSGDHIGSVKHEQANNEDEDIEIIRVRRKYPKIIRDETHKEHKDLTGDD